MPDRNRLVILTDKAFGTLVADFIGRAVPDVKAICVLTRSELERQPYDIPLIGFLTRHYVPQALCQRGPLPAYNIHPGTPDYPGWMPEIRAARDRAQIFGATLHGMAAVIDAGPIIATEIMDAQDAPDLDVYARIGFECALVLLGRFAKTIAQAIGPLDPNGDAWTGRLMLRAEVEGLMAGKID